MNIRNVQVGDLPQLLELLSHLHHAEVAGVDERIEGVWQTILNDPNHHVLVGVKDGLLVSTCVLIVVPNLTREQRPYAIIENVVTLPQYRGRGYASRILSHARELAAQRNCYKIMLMTGSRRESTLNLYRRAGFTSDDKTGFVQRLD